MESKIQNVTPKMAAAWLAKNTRNRTLNPRRVTNLARQMQDGEWRVTHQGIAFATDGTLTDGQHRLAAIVESGVTCRMMVTTGVDHFDVLDSGRARTAGDVLSVEGIGNGNVVAAAARLVIRYYDGTPRPWAKTVGVVSNQAVHLWVMANKEAITAAVAMGRKINARIHGSASAYAAAYFITMNWAKRTNSVEAAESWWEELATGAGLPKGDPRLALASWVVNTGRQGYIKHMVGELTLMLTLRAFRAALTGEELARLMIRDVTGTLVRLPGDERFVALSNQIDAVAEDMKKKSA